MNSELKDIQAKIEELKKQEQKLINDEKQTVIDRLKNEINAYHITAEELGFELKAKKKTKTKEKVIKYRNGELTWSGGRGIKPAWVQEIIKTDGEQGLEKFKVAES